MLPGESSEAVSVRLEIWGLIPNRGAGTAELLHSQCCQSGLTRLPPLPASDQKCPLDLCFHLPFV